MEQYRLIKKIGEGTFSEVLEAVHIKSGKHVAIKCMKQAFDDIDDVKELKEIQTLKKISPHNNIVFLKEILYNVKGGQLALVFELCEMNLYEMISGSNQFLSRFRVKCIIYKVLKAIDHMHKKGIFHRDIKPENILIRGDDVKLADFGCCKGVFADVPHTEYISTRWYRPPECLMTDGYYDSKIDIWGLGCVLYEIITLEPLFHGDDEIDQINKIHDTLGTPSIDLINYYQELASHMELNFDPQRGCGLANRLPEGSPECLDLLRRMLEYEPQTRITASEALRHPFFREVREIELKKEAEERSLKLGSMSSVPYNEGSMFKASFNRRKKKNRKEQSYLDHRFENSIRLPKINGSHYERKGYKSKKKFNFNHKKQNPKTKYQGGYKMTHRLKMRKKIQIDYILTGKKLF